MEISPEEQLARDETLKNLSVTGIKDQLSLEKERTLNVMEFLNMKLDILNESLAKFG